MTSERRCGSCDKRALPTDVTSARWRDELPDRQDQSARLNGEEILKAQRAAPKPRRTRGLELDTACVTAVALALVSRYLPLSGLTMAGAVVMAIIGLKNVAGSGRRGAGLAVLALVFVARPILVPLINGIFSVILVFITGGR